MKLRGNVKAIRDAWHVIKASCMGSCCISPDVLTVGVFRLDAQLDVNGTVAEKSKTK